MTFDGLLRLKFGLVRISFKDFDEVLRTSVGASKEYSQLCWPRFQDNPISYITSRNPIAQGQALFALAWSRGGES